MVFKKYVFRNYRREYPKLFRKEKRRLIKRLGKGAIIEHIGSTSIPGLGGKGIIDIAIKTPKDKACLYKKRLGKLCYKPNPHHPEDERRIFLERRIKYGGKDRRVHVHLALKKNFWNSFITFRNKLRKNPKLIEEYSGIKKKALKIAKGEGKKYHTYKSKFLEKHSK
jgi:GrpB-like predicted nucleotidyltransferase (UPF0157 family)